MKKIGLFVKQDHRAAENAFRLESRLSELGHQVICNRTPPPSKNLLKTKAAMAPPDLFCVIVLGGDGTFLSAVRWIGDQDIPVLGVKFGEVGFLAKTGEEELFQAVDAVLAGNFGIETRMRLSVRVYRSGERIADETVLNDVVINKGALARLAHIKTFIDDQYLTTYRADGLIIATPTGSTAYSLAAGGPVIHPAVPGIIMTPICPFTLTNRPLIVPDSVRIRVQVDQPDAHIMLTFDGQTGFEIVPEDRMTIEKCPRPVRLISFPEKDYFSVLKEKLGWSGGRY